jgi:hypothetical protein
MGSIVFRSVICNESTSFIFIQIKQTKNNKKQKQQETAWFTPSHVYNYKMTQTTCEKTLIFLHHT